MALPERYPLVQYLGTEADALKRVRAALETTMLVLDYQISGGYDGQQALAPLDQARARAMRAAINSHLSEMWSTVDAAIYDGQQRAMDLSVKILRDTQEDWLVDMVMADELTPELRDAILTGEAVRAQAGVQNVAARELYSKKALSDRVWNTEQWTATKLDGLISGALIRGESARDLAKKVRQFINPATPGGASYAAQRLARTEINNAHHAANMEVYKRSKIATGVEWRTSSSHPENDECDTYASDSPFALDNVPEKPHPQCLCYTTAALPSREEFIDNLFNGDYDDDLDEAVTDLVEFDSAAFKKLTRAKMEAALEERGGPTWMLMEHGRDAQLDAMRKAYYPKFGINPKDQGWLTSRGMKLKAATQAQLSKLPKMATKPSRMQDAVMGANPKGPSWKGWRGNYDYAINCTRVAATLEMRRRGYDVRAAGAPDSADTSNNWIVSNWIDPVTGTNRREVTFSSPEELHAYMEEFGEGARFLVWGAWARGGAHIWNAENMRRADGAVISRYFEAQTGIMKQVNATNLTVDYDSRLMWDAVATRMSVIRVDDLEPTDLITRAFEGLDEMRE